MRTLSPAHYEALERAYERDNYKVRAAVRTLRALHSAGLVTDPVTVDGQSYAYLTTAGLDAIESGA